MDSLPAAARTRLAEVATTIDLSLRQTIYEPGQRVDFAYFPTSGMISNVVVMNDGEAVEIGVIGREGMAGVSLALVGGTSPSSLYAQIAGQSLRVARVEMLDIIAAANGTLFAAYAEAQISALGQYAACNRLHTIDQRFARWLLIAHDRMSGDKIGLTQDFLALMLGVRRPGVTVAAAALQRAGVIAYKRGMIVVVDRVALEAASCECYAAVEQRFTELLGYSIRKSPAAVR